MACMHRYVDGMTSQVDRWHEHIGRQMVCTHRQVDGMHSQVGRLHAHIGSQMVCTHRQVEAIEPIKILIIEKDFLIANAYPKSKMLSLSLENVFTNYGALQLTGVTGLPDKKIVFLKKMGHSRPLFSLFSSFLQTVNSK